MGAAALLTVSRGLTHAAVRGRRPAIIPWEETSATHRGDGFNDDAMTIKRRTGPSRETADDAAATSSFRAGPTAARNRRARLRLARRGQGATAAYYRQKPTDARKARWEREAVPE
ncbi:hypothetical protein MRX96_055852 [Rhipicephalus microplus]